MDSGDRSADVELDAQVAKLQGWRGGPNNYSSDWSLAGPIIERNSISVDTSNRPGELDSWRAYVGPAGKKLGEEYGPTPLIAAMRAFVASRAAVMPSIDDSLDGPEGGGPDAKA